MPSAAAQGYRELTVAPRLGTRVDLFTIDSGSSIEHRFQSESDGDFAGSERITGEASDIAALELGDERYEVLIVDREHSGGQRLDPATGEVSLSAQGNFPGDGATNPLDGQSCQVIVSGRLTPALQ